MNIHTVPHTQTSKQRGRREGKSLLTADFLSLSPFFCGTRLDAPLQKRSGGSKSCHGGCNNLKRKKMERHNMERKSTNSSVSPLLSPPPSPPSDLRSFDPEKTSDSSSPLPRRWNCSRACGGRVFRSTPPSFFWFGALPPLSPPHLLLSGGFSGVVCPTLPDYLFRRPPTREEKEEEREATHRYRTAERSRKRTKKNIRQSQVMHGDSAIRKNSAPSITRSGTGCIQEICGSSESEELRERGARSKGERKSPAPHISGSGEKKKMVSLRHEREISPFSR